MLLKMTFFKSQTTSTKLPLKATPNSSLGTSWDAAGL